MRAVIFDFDGTLADSFELILEVFQEITKRSDKLAIKDIEELRGKPLKEIIRYLKIRNWQIPRLIYKAKKLVGLKMTGVDTFRGIPEVIERLHSDGYQIYIVSTNGRDNIVKFLNQYKLEGYFSGIYGDIGLRGKTSALRKLMKKEGLSVADCIYVGDETRDIAAAHKINMRCIAVTWGFNSPNALKELNPDFIANKPADLLKFTTSN